MYDFAPVSCEGFDVYKETHLYRVQTCSVRRCHSRSVYRKAFIVIYVCCWYWNGLAVVIVRFFLDSIQTTPVLQCLSSLRMCERSLAFTSQSVPDAALRKAGGCSSGTAALGVLMSAETLLISVKWLLKLPLCNYSGKNELLNVARS